MKRKEGLPRPAPNEVKIWFQGSTGSGKTLLAELIQETLRSRGLTVREYVFGGTDYVRMEDQIVDLTNQNIHDVLTVELASVEKLLTATIENRRDRPSNDAQEV